MMSVKSFNVSVALPLSHNGLLLELADSKEVINFLCTTEWQSLFMSHRQRQVVYLRQINLIFYLHKECWEKYIS